MRIFITLRKDYIIKYNVLGIWKHNTARRSININAAFLQLCNNSINRLRL